MTEAPPGGGAWCTIPGNEPGEVHWFPERKDKPRALCMTALCGKKFSKRVRGWVGIKYPCVVCANTKDRAVSKKVGT